MSPIKSCNLALVLALALAAPAALAGAPVAPAATSSVAGGARVAVFNPNRALFESPQGKAAIEKFNAVREEKNREVVGEQKELRAIEEKLNRDGAVMSDSERADNESRYRTKRQRLERRVAEIEEDLNLRRQELLNPIESLVLNTARQYAAERGISIVLGPGVIYADKSVDITDEVVKRMAAGGAAAAPQTAPRTTDPAKPAAAPIKK